MKLTDNEACEETWGRCFRGNLGTLFNSDKRRNPAEMNTGDARN